METQGVRAVDGAEALAAPPSASRARPSGRLWELDVLGHVWRFFTSVRRSHSRPLHPLSPTRSPS